MSKDKNVNVLFRWIRFNAVGAIGIGVQLSALALMVSYFEIHYILATAIAVESAILHNYVWHEKWTWSDIASDQGSGWLKRLFRFHITNGFTSLFGNLLLMQSLVETFQIPILYANLVAIAVCSVINFALSHYWVFREPVPVDD